MFVITSIQPLYSICRPGRVEPILHPWDETNFTTAFLKWIYNILKKCSGCQRIWSGVFFLLLLCPLWFDVQWLFTMNVGVSLPFHFVEHSEKCGLPLNGMGEYGCKPVPYCVRLRGHISLLFQLAACCICLCCLCLLDLILIGQEYLGMYLFLPDFLQDFFL